MMYLQLTSLLSLILNADGKGTSIYIDGAHAVHADMKGHGGTYVTIGTGAVYASSPKSKINIVSSIETEVILVGEKLSAHLWFRNFAVEQFDDPGQVHVLCQDIKSIIILQNNGRLSCCKGSKLHTRYFFITDRIKQKEIQGWVLSYRCYDGGLGKPVQEVQEHDPNYICSSRQLTRHILTRRNELGT